MNEHINEKTQKDEGAKTQEMRRSVQAMHTKVEEMKRRLNNDKII